MSNFLKDLKKAVDNEEFNSESAQLIKNISNKANDFNSKSVDEMKSSIESKVPELKPIDEKDALELNSAYEKKMEKIKKQDVANGQLATLIEVDDMVQASIDDLFSFIGELEDKFEKEFIDEDPMYGDLSLKIEEIQNKYSNNKNN